MTELNRAAQGNPPTPGQGQAAAQPDLQSEVERMKRELSERDNQIRALSGKVSSWEKNVGRELGDLVELDQYGNPVRVRVDDQPNARQSFSGSHPFAGLLDRPEAVDEYYAQQFSGRFMTPQQAESMVNKAKQEAYLAARNDLVTLRVVDRTLGTEKYKELSSYDSALSKKTAEVLSRNGWGVPLQGAQSWDQWQYAAPHAISQAAQIAKSELFEESQQTQQSQVQASAAQSAAGIAGVGSSASMPSLSADETAKKFAENPSEAERLWKAEFMRNTSGGRP